MRSALILGAGQIGTFVAGSLNATGIRTLSVDVSGTNGFYSRYSKASENDLKVLDLNDRSVIQELFCNHDWDVVINTVGVTGLTCQNEPTLAEAVNVQIPKLVGKEVAKKKNCFLIHISSFAVYGESTSVNLVENSETTPRSEYGKSKLRAEKTLGQIESLNGFILRPCGVYGPIRHGFGSHSAKFIHDALVLLKSTKELTISGAKYEGDEYIYVKDLASCITTLAKFPSTTGLATLNIGTGSKTSIDTLAYELRKIFPDSKIELVYEDPKWPALPVLDSSAITERIGFKPKFSLSNGLLDFNRELGGS